ncbi:5'-3' exonuclease H3TH domain-containing protein [Micromonospora sp. NPDC051925]|uniref:5'-3' exonuclease n=1 Tax=Micromonospora sp. NPDC051925 TaxID=3364288 RepID=UPI0037C93CC9
MAPPLFVVDGHNVMYRAWFGFPARITSRDKIRDLTGVFGFLALVRKAHLLRAPDSEMLVVFDGENATATRTNADPDYKANRADADHSPIKSLPWIKQALDAVDIRWIELEDHEADDVIASATTHAVGRGRAVVCCSGDRDFYQMLDHPTVSILTPNRAEVAGADVHRRFGVLPRQWPDYRALTGDPADNIPGIRGVGPKTAAGLLADGWHLDDLKGSPRLRNTRAAAVTENWERLLVWRDLIRLQRNVALPPDLLTERMTPPLPLASKILDQIDLW